MSRSSLVPRWILVPSVLFLQHSLLFIGPATADTEDTQCPETSDTASCKAEPMTMPADNNDFVCGLYLAKSTVPNAGLGVFSGVHHDIGDVINPPEIAHHILLQFDGIINDDDDDDDDYIQTGDPQFAYSLAHQYTWSSYVSGGGFEASYVEALIPGIGMAANCFLPLINTRSIMGKSIDGAGLYIDDGKIGPGAGAFSSYHGMTYVADEPIEAGGEIFADYGDAYFRGRPDVYGMIPLTEEFEKADRMMKILWESLPSEIIKATEDASVWQATWDAVRTHFVDDERTRNALPEQVGDLQRVAELGSAGYFLRGENPRSLEWLDSNGYCMDTLEIRTSDIPHAGRGGFSKKAFSAGERILPLPMMQIARESLQIYATTNGAQHKRRVEGHQLLLNYCFGHSNSSMVLMPYSSTAGFINHASSHSANAKVVWAEVSSDPTDFHQNGWMEQPVKELLTKGYAGLLMHLVATRDIKQGEEVTIDYGSTWIEAWQDHVANWPDNDAHTSASELNVVEDHIRTIFEEPYPEGVTTACHYRYGSTQDEKLAASNPNNRPVDGSIRVEEIEEHAFRWIDYGGRSTISGDYFRPCEIVARHADPTHGSVYTVKMVNRPNQLEWDQIPAEYHHYVKDVPRRAILFVNEPYTSHQHHKHAFRHEIGFPNPDDTWPSAWIDNKESN